MHTVEIVLLVLLLGALTGIAARHDDVAMLSAVSGEGVEALRRLIGERMTVGNRVYRLPVAASDGAALAWLHEYGEVLSIVTDEDPAHQDSAGGDARFLVSVRLSDAAHARFLARMGMAPDTERDED